MRVVWYLLLSIPLLHAETPAGAAEWIGKLTETYQKQRGYITSYHSEGENKSLDVTLASIPGSGLAVLHLVSSKEGRKMEIREWSTRPGDVYIKANGRRGHMLGIREEIQALGKIFTREEGHTHLPAFTPELLLTKTEVGVLFSITSLPAWANEVEGATLGKVSKESVTLLTRDHGEMTISRETGLLLRQSIPGEGEQRVLTLMKHRGDPSEDELVALTDGWSTAGAEPIDGGMRQSMRTSFFQDLIHLVERDELPMEELTRQMTANRAGLDDFAGLCFSGNPDSRFAKMDWEGLARQARTTVREAWEKKYPDSGEREEEFDAFWAREGKKAADGFLTKFAGDPEVSRSALGDILGPGAGLTASTARGEEAREFIIATLSRAYLERILREKLTPLLGEKENPE